MEQAFIQLHPNLSQEIEDNATCNEMMTRALRALEEREYTMAITFIRYCLEKSSWIEQRMACVSLLTTATARDEKVTAAYLQMIYK